MEEAACWGEGHFHARIKRLPGEILLWEGGAAKQGPVIRGAQAGLVILMPLLFLLFLFGGLFLIPSSGRPGAKSRPASSVGDVASNPAPSPEDAARRRREKRVFTVFVGSIALLLIGGLITEARLSCRNAWYVVTSERICIQSGALGISLTVIDLDKVLAVQVSASWLERRFALQSIEILHGGVKAPGGGRAIPFVMAHVPAAGSLASDLLNSWLPRDNRRTAVG